MDNPEARFCHQVLPSRPDFKMLATFNLPLSLIVSGTYQISSGPMITATWAAPNSLIAAPSALGRNLAAGATATKSIQLIEPGTLYAGYQNQLDLRLSRRLTFGRYRVRADINLYNVFNNAYANSINTDVLDNRQQSVPAADCRPGGPFVQDRRTGGFLGGLFQLEEKRARRAAAISSVSFEPRRGGAWSRPDGELRGGAGTWVHAQGAVAEPDDDGIERRTVVEALRGPPPR